MSLDTWLKRHAETGSWSQHQPLEPFPSFRHRPVAAGWEQMERLALHQLRRGVDVNSLVRWFQAIDSGWAEPDGLVCVIVPARSAHPGLECFRLAFVGQGEPEAFLEQVSDQVPYQLEVYQRWPGSVSLCRSLRAACSNLEGGADWLRWSESEVADMGVALDVVAQAWAHRRYWFGLDRR